MAIFIGRNTEESTKAWLKQRQLSYVEQPLIDVQLNAPDYSFFHKIALYNKHWIITSKWAAFWLLRYYKNIGFSSSDSVFCLSEKQAAIIREFSNSVFVSKAKNSKSLSELIHRKSTDELKVFLKGNRSLEASRLEIVEVEVYQNNLLKPSVKNEFDSYLFFSPSGVQSFVEGGNQIPKYSTIVAIGETTAQAAKSKFANGVVVSENQNEIEMLELTLLAEAELSRV